MNSQRSAPRRSYHTKRITWLDPKIYKCMVCKGFHALRFCKKFLKMNVSMRKEIVNEHRYCNNCLARSHNLRGCTSMDMCKKCDKFHHTLLHPNTRQARHPKRVTTNQLRHKRIERRLQKQQNQNQRPNQHAAKKTKSKRKPVNKPSTSSNATTPPTLTTSAVPNASVIIEAIKSLATVLCTSEQHSIA